MAKKLNEMNEEELAAYIISLDEEIKKIIDAQLEAHNYINSVRAADSVSEMSVGQRQALAQALEAQAINAKSQVGNPGGND